MIPQEAWRYTDAMKDELNRTGRLAMYKGKNIIIHNAANANFLINLKITREISVLSFFHNSATF